MRQELTKERENELIIKNAFEFLKRQDLIIVNGVITFPFLKANSLKEYETYELSYCKDSCKTQKIKIRCKLKSYGLSIYLSDDQNLIKLFDKIYNRIKTKQEQMKQPQMNNMESLYESFKYYFDYDRKYIEHFLDVLKNVKEDKWEYEANTERSCGMFYFIRKTEVLKYDTIKIVCINEHYDNLEDADTDFIVTVRVDNVKIFETQDETSELSIEILDFIERVEKRVKPKG